MTAKGHSKGFGGYGVATRVTGKDAFFVLVILPVNPPRQVAADAIWYGK
jgi:hypothetical protein